MGDMNNQDEQARQRILEDFQLKEEECEIKRQGIFYTIRPAIGRWQLDINAHVENIDVFNQYHLNFENCTFKGELFFNDQTFSRKIIFKNCTFEIKAHFSNAIFKDMVKFCDSTFRRGAVFLEATFEKWVDFSVTTLQWMEFSHANFKRGVDFSRATFRKWVVFRMAIFEREANFSGAKFEREGDISGMDPEESESLSIIYHDEWEAIFSDAKFKKEANFSNANFKVDVCFNDAKFQKANFSDAIFLQNAYFQNSHFNKQAFFSHAAFQQASFRGSIFDSNAYFFEARFGTIPDFLQVSFNKNINFTNTELDFGFDETRKKIGEIYDDRKRKYDMEQDEEDKDEPKKYKIANEFRDSFRNIKSALIKDNNMLDASNYHRVELYFKELELGYRNSGIRDFVDRIQLYCYRVTSEHHTDLALILNNIIFLIALFGLANFTLVFSSQADIIRYAFLAVENTKLLEIPICIICISTIMCIMLKCCDIIYFIIFLPIFVLVLYIHPAYVVLMILTCCVLVLYLMVLPCFQPKPKKNLTQKCFFTISYPIVAFMLIFNPSSILPVLGKLIENKTPERCHYDDFDIFGFCPNTPSFASETLNLIYMLFLFLLLWSLQKTARKNTIVPS